MPERVAAVEDRPLLFNGGANNHDERDENAYETPRRWRGRRADVACLSILGIVATFMLVRQPPVPVVSVTPVPLESALAVPFVGQYLTYDDIAPAQRTNGYSVAYTKRGFEIDGRATLLLGGSVHYPRSTPAMWEDLLRKAKHDGLNHIELYVFWNLHEPTPDAFHLDGRANLTAFYETAMRVGLFLHVRFGPYACAEWNNGGLPLWLDAIPGMDVRSSAVPWKREMRRFVHKMVELSRPYLAMHGGPIILAQIENEYNGDDLAYVQWCGELTTELNVSVPWVMCNGRAANNTILACNDNDCANFAHRVNHARPTEPLMWTENEGWYQKWAIDPANPHPEQMDQRSAEDMAYTVARWFAVGAAHHNYYMYHGGNNYGRSASAGVTTMYADGVNLHSDGLSNEPKRSHLRKLHEVIIASNNVLLANERQVDKAVSLGPPTLNAYVYGSGNADKVVFIENSGPEDADVTFEGLSYHLASSSVVIVKGGVIQFDTSAVRDSYPRRQMRVFSTLVSSSSLKWKSWTEPSTDSPRRKIVDHKPLEQLAVTKDESDYLIYETTFTLTSSDGNDMQDVVVSFTACEANGFLVYLDGQFVEEVHFAYPGEDCAKPVTVKLPAPSLDHSTQHKLTIVSVSLGLHSLGKRHRKGIIGDVVVNGGQSLVASTKEWAMYPGLVGEELKIYEPKWSASVQWTPLDSGSAPRSRMTWYKSTFKLAKPSKRPRTNPVEETSSILIDCDGLTRGRVYLNGHDLGRYWLITDAKGDAIQRYYHIPPDWLRTGENGDDENELVVFDELGGSLASVRVVLSKMLDDFADPVAEIVGGRHDTRQSPEAATVTTTESWAA